MPKITIKCVICGNDFEGWASKKSKYCSKACFFESKKGICPKGLIDHRGTKPVTRVKKICVVCSKSFEVEQHRKDAAKYCSIDCLKKQEIVKCLSCSKEFSAKISEARKYCSDKCARKHSRITRQGAVNPSWKGGITKPEVKARGSAEFQDWRKAVLQRDGYKCQNCNSVDDLETHHIKSFKTHPELLLELSNGITLCRICHCKQHGYKTVGGNVVSSEYSNDTEAKTSNTLQIREANSNRGTFVSQAVAAL